MNVEDDDVLIGEYFLASFFLFIYYAIPFRLYLSLFFIMYLNFDSLYEFISLLFMITSRH